MRKAIVFPVLIILLLAMSLPAVAYDQTGTVGLGYRFGLHTVAKDPWSMKFMHGGEFKLGLHPHVSLAVTGTYGRTGCALLMTDAFPPTLDEADKDDPARLRLTSYIVEVGPLFNLMPEENFNIFISTGVGFGTWAVKDLDGNTAMVPDGEGDMFKLNDQQLTLMIGAGFEWWPWESVPQISFNGSARYHAYTSVFSNFKDASEGIDEATGGDGLDIPSGLFEFGVGVTAYLAKCPDEDNDGVCDDKDKCPGTPECVDSVDEDGCPYDTDGDGVYNGCDSCPDTPPHCDVDRKGCSRDPDNDGVCDGVDECPDTKAGCEVDAVGCAIDTDKDGIPDCSDRCPGTPTCCEVDAEGCDRDSDNDGVCDGCDDCEGTPPEYKDAVDSKGCPTGIVEPTHMNLNLLGVNFVPNGFALTGAAQDSLNRVVEQLKAYPHLNIEVHGHTDSQGREGFNDTLSTNRAQAVVDYFVSQGLRKDRFFVKGHGERDLLYDPDDTPQKRRDNRRVELRAVQR